jgi:glycosyltransferase involved in cell wall biosynthesis
MSTPFFSIGVPTYNRHHLLRQTLESILTQSFTDFEIIVGNDYTDEILTAELLGISDSRLIIINHHKNLREAGNMNALLAQAQGTYFTWLNDDDLYEPDYLRHAYETLVNTGFPPALFPSYRVLQGDAPFLPSALARPPALTMNGRQYLEHYAKRRIDIISTCGLFETGKLKEIIGGVEEVCDSAVGLYCEYVFLVRCAQLGVIVYLEAPYVVLRAHADSWGERNSELEKYLVAGKALLIRCATELNHPDLAADFSTNLLTIARLHLIPFAAKATTLEFDRTNSKLAVLYRAGRHFFREVDNIWESFITLNGSHSMRTRIHFLTLIARGCHVMWIIFHRLIWRLVRDKYSAMKQGKQ